MSAVQEAIGQRARGQGPLRRLAEPDEPIKKMLWDRETLLLAAENKDEATDACP